LREDQGKEENPVDDIPCQVRYAAEGPYPEVRAGEKNWRYGQAMLSNVGGGTSEMSAVARYIHSGFVQAGRREVADCFRHIAMVEMHHLDIFGQLAHQLGEDPRLWAPFRGGRRYWTPEYLRYPRPLEAILRQTMEEEQTAVRKYSQQALWIRDENVVANLRRIIADEEVHIQVLTELLDSYCSP
jgi:bacterioferritin